MGSYYLQGYVMMSTDCKRWKFKDSVQVLTYTAHIIIQYRKAIKLAHTSEIKEAVERLITGCENKSFLIFWERKRETSFRRVNEIGCFNRAMAKR